MSRLSGTAAGVLLASLVALGPSAPLAVGDRPITRPVTFETPPDGPLRFRGALAVTPPFAAYAGLSGLAMDGPRDAVAVTDKGDWLRLALRIEAGWLTGLDGAETTPIVDLEGERISGLGFDAEDLTRDAATGDYWIAFEHDHRLWRAPSPGARPTAELRHPRWANFSGNAGIEALAQDDAGRLWAVREVSGKQGRPFPVFVTDGETWEIKRLPRPTMHAITGAAFGPDGWFYVTERRFSFLTGFDIRIRRLRWGAGAKPVADELLLDLPSQTGIDNIEAITIWREGDETFLLIASDDNAFVLQRNILALFVVEG